MNRIYDTCVVGAGPAGATLAYYLATYGRSVLVIERKRFPRDKTCGDAVCGHALNHLRRMGALDQIISNDEGHFAEVGGMVSPRGIAYIGNSAAQLHGAQVIAVKRIYLDSRIAQAACAAGAELTEDCAVSQADFDADRGIWTLRTEDGRSYRAHALVAADGAVSRLARRLGYLDSAPDAVCSRAYIRARTSNFEHDGVVFYQRGLLPGYCALFREARGELNFCLYLMPGGTTGTNDLRRAHEHAISSDPHVSSAIGSRAEIDPMKGAPLRLGGIRRSFGDHFLIVGDAAGQIDPLTGEGIQYAMDAAEIGAQVLDEALSAGDLRATVLRRYQDRWMQAFGRDFPWSAAIARFYTRFPTFLDASAATLRRLGPPFLARWAQIMVGTQPKTEFLKPQIVLPILRDMVALRLGVTP